MIDDHAFNHINATITDPIDNNSWILTCLYGSPYRKLKLKSWNIIKQMAGNVDKPWLVIGDLNVVLHEEEKKSRFAFKKNEAKFFNNLINKCNLIDLGFTGYTYTWNNNRQEDDNIEQRLDRALVNGKWNRKYPNSSIKHLGPLASDHVPIKLNMHNNWDDGPTPFKFFGEWLKHADCKKLIQDSWNINVKGSSAHKVNIKLSTVKHTLKLWNRKNIGNINRNIQNIKKQLIQINSTINCTNKTNDIARLRTELAKWYAIKNFFGRIRVGTRT
ncbi:uncharacterized protein LOC113333598 [Papaver somniferum]|uniref:uncharacterized protein LOC113333598 n=1 Tax=Papaver somniferum TaxID=3469 RepID=UPI000E703FF1|nr:uncharacterized protein LOC113333598 [Papaver somniferum]